MNINLHIMLCVIFIFSTWIYFLKCEINELRRRLDEHSGEHAYSTTTETAPTAPHVAALPAAIVTAGKKPIATPAHAHAGSVRVAQQGGIPTWKID